MEMTVPYPVFVDFARHVRAEDSHIIEAYRLGEIDKDLFELFLVENVQAYAATPITEFEYRKAKA